MTIRAIDAWALGRLLSRQDVDGEQEVLSDQFRPLGQHLAALSLDSRQAAWAGYLCGRPNRDEIISALADQDPIGPAPESKIARITANVSDLAGFQSSSRFVWSNWIVRAHFNLFSSNPKIGKTYVTLDLARRIWFAQPFPDGQPSTFPKESPTLWVCGDRHQDELRDYATSFGLPPEAILLNATPDEPYSGCNLDHRDSVDGLRRRVEAERPALVVIDTVWRATRYKMHVETEVNTFFDPLVAIAQEFDTTILGLMHLSKDDETLGRRLEGLARSIIKLSRPDATQLNRRKLAVSGNFKEPPPLGVTLRDGGCDFDADPPAEMTKKPGGRPPGQRDEAKAFISNALDTKGDLIGNELCGRFEKEGRGSKKTFWRAVDEMEESGDLVTDGGKGTGKQKLLHLFRQNSTEL